jgi:hypothetical protein
VPVQVQFWRFFNRDEIEKENIGTMLGETLKFERNVWQQYKKFKKDKGKECRRKKNNYEDSLIEMKLKRKNVGKVLKETFKLKEMSDRAL